MAPYARKEVAAIAIVGGLLTAVTAWYLLAWATVPAVVMLGLLAFYRDPRREPPVGRELLLAPADGKVVEIARDVDDGGRRALRITIFLSVFNVHLNRSPCAGRVASTAYRRGGFLNALRAEADVRNESNTVTLEPVAPLPGPIRVRQIAGVLARRIVCAVRDGERLTAGQRIGMIKLGSRTALTVPEDAAWEVLVHEGAHVKAGVTVLARWQNTMAVAMGAPVPGVTAARREPREDREPDDKIGLPA